MSAAFQTKLNTFRRALGNHRPRLYLAYQEATPTWCAWAQSSSGLRRVDVSAAVEPSGMGKGGKKWYAVAKGRQTGVFSSWLECQAHVKGFSGAVFKSFGSRSEAESFSKQGSRGGYSINVKAPQFKSARPAQQRAVHSSMSIHAQAQGYEAQMFFDGGSRGNPGPGGCGAAVFSCSDRSTITSRSAFLGHTTNNRAEYEGLILGLKIALDSGVNSISVHGDSKLVVMQVNGQWQAHDPELAILRDHVVQKLLTKFENWQVHHVRRENNSEADRLANDAMDHGMRTGLIEQPSHW